MADILKAICGSRNNPLKVGDMLIPCYVLENGMRVLKSKAINFALWFWSSQNVVFYWFLDKPELKPFIDMRLVDTLTNPIRFMRPGRWWKLAMWYEATVFLKICNVLVQAQEQWQLTGEQNSKTVKQAKAVLKKFAGISINDVVDRVSGYQEMAQRLQLRDMLQKHVETSLLNWSLLLPKDLFEEVCRLKGRSFDEALSWKFSTVLKYLHQYIYDQLPDWVLELLKTSNPKNKMEAMLPRFPQWLVLEIGSPALRMQTFVVMKLMRISRTRQHFERYFAQAFPE